MNNRPLVTIICLCFNHERYVQRCIESIINQSYSKIEFIIIDNGSKDNSVKNIVKYKDVCSNRFTNYRFINNETNMGIPTALNQAIKLSNGEYISFISGDDIYIVDKIDTQLKCFLNLDNSYAVVCGNCDFIDKDNNKIFLNDDGQICHKGKSVYETGTEFILRKRNTNEIMLNYGDYRTLLQSNYINAASVLIKKEVLEDVGFFDESFFYEDWPLWLQISRRYKFYYLDKVFFHYRKYPSTTTVSFRDKFNLENKRIILREKYYCFNNNYKALWVEQYSGRILSLIKRRKNFTFIKFLLKSRSISIYLFILKKIIKKIGFINNGFFFKYKNN